MNNKDKIIIKNFESITCNHRFCSAEADKDLKELVLYHLEDNWTLGKGFILYKNDGEDKVELRQILVNSSYRRKGYAKNLIDELVKIVGNKKIWLKSSTKKTDVFGMFLLNYGFINVDGDSWQYKHEEN